MKPALPRRLTRSVEKRITDDWRRRLPGLAVYRPRRLLRRVGPLLIGVCLDRDSGGEVYTPYFHVHFLGREFSTVSLTMCTQLRAASGGPDYVEVRFHEEKYEDAVRRLVEQAPLPLEGPVTLAQTLRAYRDFQATPYGRRFSMYLHDDCTLLLAWCDRSDEARQALDETLAAHPNEDAYRHFGGKEAYVRTTLEAIERPETVRQTVDRQVCARSLGDVPTEDFQAE